MELTVERVIQATPSRLYEAWTSARELSRWWGPPGVRCLDATVDARVGGRYAIEHGMPDGSRLVIHGEFTVITPPRLLEFTWRVGESGAAERVRVSFEPVEGAGTRVTVHHTRIDDVAMQKSHRMGWDGCLAGLARLFERP